MKLINLYDLYQKYGLPLKVRWYPMKVYGLGANHHPEYIHPNMVDGLILTFNRVIIREDAYEFFPLEPYGYIGNNRNQFLEGHMSHGGFATDNAYEYIRKKKSRLPSWF